MSLNNHRTSLFIAIGKDDHELATFLRFLETPVLQMIAIVSIGRNIDQSMLSIERCGIHNESTLLSTCTESNSHGFFVAAVANIFSVCRFGTDSQFCPVASLPSGCTFFWQMKDGNVHGRSFHVKVFFTAVLKEIAADIPAVATTGSGSFVQIVVVCNVFFNRVVVLVCSYKVKLRQVNVTRSKKEALYVVNVIRIWLQEQIERLNFPMCHLEESTQTEDDIGGKVPWKQHLNR
mmetsp:Transcript_18265/g.33952  ORF Transcript_18265/g.33952 Transcript_18265/m.33952 type:complete len:234 (+) Transcript_18265:1072-1773(+)